MKRIMSLAAILLLIVPVSLLAVKPVNKVVTITTSDTEVLNAWNRGDSKGKGGCDPCFILLNGACRVAFNTTTDNTTPVYPANTVFTIGAGDNIQFISASTTNGTTTINVGGNLK